MKNEEIITTAKKVIEDESAAVLTLVHQIDNNFVDAVRLMLDCQGHVLVAGAGTSHSVARRLAHLLSCCGTPALLIDVGDSQHGLSGAVTKRDILITLSKGGQTKEVITLAKVAKARGAKIIALTEKLDSELSKMSDVVLKVVAPPDVDPYGMVATGSSLVNAAFGDALCVVLMKMKGYSVEEFGETHPGGAVGKKIKDLDILIGVKMKAAYLVGSKTFSLREIEDPIPEADGIVVEVKACGVCGSDLRRWKEGPTGEPVISGHEVSGIVSAIGEGMTKYKVGDRIAIAPDVHCGECSYCKRGLYNLCDNLRFIGITSGYHGGFADYIALNEEILINGIVHKIPASLSFDHAALSEPCSSVLASHDRIGTSIDDVVVVMGAGPIGCIHTAVAHARGARVLISEPSDTRRKLAEVFNPEAMINPFEEDLDGAVRLMTDGRGADVVICANPVATTQTQAVEIVRKRGKVVLFGGLPKADPTTIFDGNKIHYEEIEVIGSFSYHPSDHEFALETLERGLIPAEKLITVNFSLDEVDSAFETAASGKALKVIVNP